MNKNIEQSEPDSKARHETLTANPVVLMIASFNYLLCHTIAICWRPIGPLLFNNKNLAIANRSRDSCAHNSSRAYRSDYA